MRAIYKKSELAERQEKLKLETLVRTHRTRGAAGWPGHGATRRHARLDGVCHTGPLGSRLAQGSARSS